MFNRNCLLLGMLFAFFLLLFPLSGQAESLGEISIDGKEYNFNSYEVPHTSREKAKEIAYEKHNEAMEIARNFFKEQGAFLNEDLDDPKYRKQIFTLGTAFDVFSDEDLEKIIEYVKFVDLYDNYDINNRIKDLINKPQLGEHEKKELLHLLPATEVSTIDSTNSEPIFNSELTFSISSNGYKRFDARDYAYKWTSNERTLRNNSVYGYYSKYYNCNACWNDCTNFVSQALKAGGMKERGIFYGSNSAWFYSNSKPSHTWGGAHNFYHHWKERAGIASSTADLKTGDVVNADFSGDGTINHTAIITKHTAYNSRGLHLTQHTTDRKEVYSNGSAYTLKKWYDSGYKVYGYEMDEANN